jgi:large subunit ribosomal protein L37Ae
MGNSKKVGAAGRFGSRYGIGIRKKLLKIESKQERNYRCPFCGFKKVGRKAAGLYVCRKCQATFAGGAYFPSTLPGLIIRKTVSQKGFASEAKALEAIMERGSEEETADSEEKNGKEKEEKKGKQKK